MRRFIGTALAGLILMGSTMVFVGCNDEAGTKSETQITGPGGKTTVTDETKIKQSGENPPPVPGGPKTTP
jgi:hypothetical protein